MKIISKTIFWSRSLKSVATDSLLQESSACVDTTPSLLYCVNRDVCRRVRVCLYIYRCPCAKTHCEPNTASPPPFLSYSSSHSLCFSYITARRPRPNLHFSSFASLSLSAFFYSLLFSPHSSPSLFNLLL